MDEKENVTKTRVRRVKKIPVKVIRTDKKVILVEYVLKGLYNRVVLPVGSVTAGKVPEDILAAGIPHGIPWENFGVSPIDISEFANELRRNGIYDKSDFLVNQRVAFVILQKMLGATRSDLRKFVSSFEKHEEA